METLKIFLVILCFGFFFISVIVTLLNNSASIFLNHGIFVQSSYPPTSFIKQHIKNASDVAFRKSLRKALVLRRLNEVFAIFSLICGIFLAILTF